MREMLDADIMLPAGERGVWVRLTELHGVMGGPQWEIRRQPFWMPLERCESLLAEAEAKGWP